jgi:hypothetical protein
VDPYSTCGDNRKEFWVSNKLYVESDGEETMAYGEVSRWANGIEGLKK